jgi:hypothetical protein
MALGSHPARYHQPYPVSSETWENADPVRQPGFRHARNPANQEASLRKMITAGAWSHMGPTLAPPATAKITKIR